MRQTAGLLLPLALISLATTGHSIKYKLCSSKWRDSCSILNAAESKVECVNVVDSIDCSLKLQNREADFAIFTAEEMLLAANFIDEDVRVLYESRFVTKREEPFKFQAVALVKSNFTGTLKDLRGKNFCHPGFSHSQLWTDRVLKHFEQKVVQESNACSPEDKDKTAVENELTSLAKFFGKICRPGDWVVSDWQDKQLKQQFPELCSLCDIPTGCSYKKDQPNKHYAALECVVEGDGDVAYVALHFARQLFGDKGTDKANYLCPDGSTQPFNTKSPCAWLKQPWDAIVARKAAASEIQKLIQRSVIASDTRRLDTWETVLRDTLLERDHELHERSTPTKLSDYVTAGREMPKKGSGTECRSAVRWCTQSDVEALKCDWLSYAGLTHGVVPELSCVRGVDQWDCLSKISSGAVDIVGLDSELGYIAASSYGVTSAAYQETTAAADTKIAIIVRSNITATWVPDLQNMKACFPEYGGIAWISFVQTLRETKSAFREVCPHGEQIASFFTALCAPGAYDHRFDPESLNENATNFCSLCAQIQQLPPQTSNADKCPASPANQLYGNNGAIKCLTSGLADFAVVQGSNHLRKLLLETNDYRVLCPDGTKRISFDDECLLTTVLGGEVVARSSRSEADSREILHLLLEFDDWFGVLNRNQEDIFHLYKPFKGQRDVLLKSDAIGLLSVYSKQSTPIKNYAKLLDKADSCVTVPSAAVILSWALSSLLLIVIAAVL